MGLRKRGDELIGGHGDHDGRIEVLRDTNIEFAPDESDPHWLDVWRDDVLQRRAFDVRRLVEGVRPERCRAGRPGTRRGMWVFRRSFLCEHGQDLGGS
jgi:hypothetical protein